MSEQVATIQPKKYRFRLMVGGYHEADWAYRHRNPDGTETLVYPGKEAMGPDGKPIQLNGTEVWADLNENKTYRAVTDPSVKLTFDQRFPLIETDIDLATRYNRPNSQRFAPADKFLGQDLNTEEGIQRQMDLLQSRLQEVRAKGGRVQPSTDGINTMGLNELRQYAQAEGIELSKDLRTKEQIVAAIQSQIMASTA
jgi:hypothetical protein